MDVEGCATPQIPPGRNGEINGEEYCIDFVYFMCFIQFVEMECCPKYDVPPGYIRQSGNFKILYNLYMLKVQTNFKKYI